MRSVTYIYYITQVPYIYYITQVPGEAASTSKDPISQLQKNLIKLIRKEKCPYSEISKKDMI